MKTLPRHMRTTVGAHIMPIFIEVLLVLPGSRRSTLGSHIWMEGMVITVSLLQRVQRLKAVRATSLVSQQKAPCRQLRHQRILLPVEDNPTDEQTKGNRAQTV